MSTIREKILMAIEELSDVLERLDRDDIVEFEATPPTNEEISLNLSGTADFHIVNPDQFAKMKPFYDPARVPFTVDSWFLSASRGKDYRPYKIVEKDGKPFRAINPQAGGDVYWIAKGVSDVTALVWNELDIKYDQPEEVRIEFFRNYKGGLNRSTAGWPERYREAYESTHS